MHYKHACTRECQLELLRAIHIPHIKYRLLFYKSLEKLTNQQEYTWVDQHPIQTPKPFSDDITSLGETVDHHQGKFIQKTFKNNFGTTNSQQQPQI